MPKDPVFLKIPTQRIRPNPNQPRRFITQSAIDAMEASLRTIGQQTPAKVIKLEVSSSKFEVNGKKPDNLTNPLDGLPYEYELIGGHIRHAGALKAGLATLDCLVLDLSPEQAELAGLVDNQTTDMHWLDWVIAIEKLNQGPAKLKQQAIADQLGVSQARVNNALKIAKALTQSSRGQIYQQLIKLGPDKTVTERPTLALAGLGDPQAVEKALPIFLARRMTAPQAQTLVKHLKDGRPLEDYGKPNPVPTAPSGTAHTPAPVQPTHTSPVPASKPEDDFNFSKWWTEMKADMKKDFGQEPTWEPYVVLFVCIGILGGMGWVVLKVLGWLIHLI